jgi:hypothetical protein
VHRPVFHLQDGRRQTLAMPPSFSVVINTFDRATLSAKTLDSLH